MKKENRTELEMPNEEKNLELSDEQLGGLNGGAFHHHKTRNEPKPVWTDVDPEDGSSGVTYTW